jgi:16S rRNA (uracil1498-N3)-methyltransferase
MSERFYVSSPLKPGQVILEGAEARHLATVCRLRAGDAVCLFNGDGRQYPATVQEVGKRTVALLVLGAETPERELSFRLVVAAPLPKGDRAQFLIEKLTELGVSGFVPLLTRRSVVQPRESTHDKLQRWVIEASKQCGRNRLMEIGSAEEWASYCRRDDLPMCRLVAHCGEAPAGTGQLPGKSDVAVAVGPEGGFTEEEVAAARHAGWQVIGLGPRVLRIETAALALAAIASVSRS